MGKELVSDTEGFPLLVHQLATDEVSQIAQGTCLVRFTPISQQYHLGTFPQKWKSPVHKKISN